MLLLTGRCYGFFVGRAERGIGRRWSAVLVAVGLGLGLAPAEATPSVSVDPLVRRLPVSLRSSWTALFESDSLQSASVTRPRIVLFDSTTSVAFSGQDEELERWSFDLGTDRFTFSSERPRGAGRAAAGAKACAACHGADPRPIWHEYPTWRGAFGSANDRLRGTEATQFAQFMRVRSRLSSYRWLRQIDHRRQIHLLDFAQNRQIGSHGQA